MGARILYADEFVVLSVIEEGRGVSFTRTGETLISAVDARGTLSGVLRALAGIDTSKMGLVVDVRSVSGRNDDAFEQGVMPAFRALTGRFARVAVLVTSRAGALQVGRLAKDQGGGIDTAFTDEDQARRYACGTAGSN